MTISAHDTPDAGAVLAALMRWYEMAGVDSFAGDTARDRFAETAAEGAMRQAQARPGEPGRAPAARDRQAPGSPPAPSRPAMPSSAAPSASAPALPAWSAPVSGAAATDDARGRARQARTLAELHTAYAAFEGCALKATARSLVFGDGPDRADLMLVGEAPGRDEDIAGVPFVGRSGQLLARMLAAIGLERSAVRVAHVVAWRPPGNRSPTMAETEMCLPFLLRQIELVSPRVVICLGAPPAKAVLANHDGITRLRGRWSALSLPGLPAEVAATVLLDPAYLLRYPAQKRQTWLDLLAVKARLEQA